MNVQEHDKALHAVLTRFQELNLTLRKHKCQFYMLRIEFFGMVFSAQGMSPDPAKVKAIKQADPPTSVSDVRSLLGMTNYVSRLSIIMQTSPAKASNSSGKRSTKGATPAEVQSHL